MVVSADEELAEAIGELMTSQGWAAVVENDTQQAVIESRETVFGCIIVVDSDHRGSVRDVLTGLSVGATTPVIALVNAQDVKTAVDAMKLGARAIVELRDNQVDSIRTALMAAVDEAVPKGDAPLQDRDPRDIIIRAKNSPMNDLLAMLPQILSFRKYETLN